MFKIEVIQNNIPEIVFVYGKKSILRELEEQNIFSNYNCRQGHCGVCMTKLISGEVDDCNSIYPTNDGEVLICQAKPITDICIKIT